MSVLVDKHIRERGIFTPFNERTLFGGMTYGLSCAGYDVRIAQDITLSGSLYGPVKAKLASTIEHFNMPNDLIAEVKDKSTWARRFVFVQNTVIEPGWRGYLTLEITYDGWETIHIPAGSPIAQIVFHTLSGECEKPYNGKYQDQLPGPVEAKLEGIS